MRTEDSPSGSQSHAIAFTTTHWSVVLAAGEAASPQATDALGKLCRLCWYPLYVYVRRRGYSVEDAQDLTQQFFEHVLQKGTLSRADATRGRFRTFLLGSLRNFLTNEWKRNRRAKRGGGVPLLSLDAENAEHRYTNEPATTLTPEHAYERRWAMTLLEQVLANLQQEYARAGNSPLFDELSDLLWGRDVTVSYAGIGERLGMTEGAVRAAMHRLRQRYRERLRAEVAHTLADVGDVDEELRYLIAVVGQREEPPPA